MTDASDTSRMLPRHSFVLVVHGTGDDVQPLCAHLKSRAAVRETTNPFDAVEALTSRRRAAIVCYLGTRVHAEDFYKMVARTTDETARIVFVAGPYAAAGDAAYLKSIGHEAIDHSATPEEIAAVVDSVVTRNQ
ncbi:MAG TPA: hypothetical protein VGH28_02380 [Polyangiaceae bacterium]|jgi:hypothetical protein